MIHRFSAYFLLLTLLLSLFGTSPLSSAVPVSASAPGVPAYAADHLILRLRPEVRPDVKALTTHIASLDRSLQSLQAVELRPLANLRDTYRLQLAEGADIQAAVELLNADPAVEYAEPDYLAVFASAPNDPRYSEQWGALQVQAEAAWAQTTGSPAVVIAVIDSGVDLAHEDLAPNLWINPGEIAGNSLDDDNNGFTDDVRGWNFVNQTNDVQDGNGHGSLVAGVAAARSGNSLGIAGICGTCRIMPVKITQLSGIANYSDIALGIYYAADKGARVINLSVGGYADSITVRNAINYALSKNIAIVAGAGNDNLSTPFYPAAYDGVIAVAGTDSGDLKTATSNFGSWVDLSAPAADILSTTLGGYASASGTSFSAPFVSGAAGLLLSLHPEWTPAMLRAQFTHTADDLDALNPALAGQLGAGRLNISTALQDPQPILSYQSYTGNGTPGLRPDYGSTVNLNLTIFNDWADALNATATLSSSDPKVTVTTPAAGFGDILSGQSAANSTPFTFTIAASAGYNHPMPFSLALSANGGAYTTTLNFTITTRSNEEVVGGTIESNTTWTNDKIYKVTDNLGIPPGVTLTIQPGSVVRFAGNYTLTVGGTLIAQGTPDQPIRFEPYTAGGNWNRIFLSNSSPDAQTSPEGAYLSGTILQHVQLSGAAGGIYCNSATPFLDHITTDRGGLACYLGATDLWLADSSFTGGFTIKQGGASPEHLTRVQVQNGDATIPASLVQDSTFSGSLYIEGGATVTNTTVKSLGVQGAGNVSGVTSSNSISVQSGTITQSSVTLGGIYAGPASTISYCTVAKGTISAGAGSTITRNNVEYAEETGIATSGSSTVTYNRVNGAELGIETVGGVVENNLIANTHGNGNGLQVGAASVRNNTLINIKNYGVVLTGVPTAFEYNNFEFNNGAYDVYVNVAASTAETIPAGNNWWGTSDPNQVKARIYDYYDNFERSKLVFEPLLSAPSQTAPGYVRSVTLNPASPVGIQTVEFTVEFSRAMEPGTDVSISGEPTFTDTWVSKANMPLGRTKFGAATASNGKIYVIGGLIPNGATSSVLEYNPKNNTWSTKANMPAPRYSMGVAAAKNGKLYTIGGIGSGTLASLDEYDPLTDTWISKTSMPTPRQELGIVAADEGKIYAIGGMLENTDLCPIIEEYDPDADTWTRKADAPVTFSEFGITYANKKIYVIGGIQNGFESSAVWEYDPITETWISKASLPVGRMDPGVATGANGKIYVIGGLNSSLVNEYDPLTNQWTTRTKTITFRSNLEAAPTPDGKIYAIGGSRSGSPLPTAEEYTIPGWGRADVNYNSTWLSANEFRASYDFSVLNPKGEYRLTVSGAYDTDGMLIIPDTRTTFTVDYAGEISDTTPPAMPGVLAWGDGSLNKLFARAEVKDPETPITGYRYAIGTTPGGTQVVGWTNTSSGQITRSGLSLQANQAYYVSVMARNAAGLWSPVGSSNAVINGAGLKFIYLPSVRK